MAFFFTCGTHTFTSSLKGYENVVVQCQNCGNVSARPYKRWEWFTFCFIPVIPFSLKPYHDVGCHICNFYQPIKYRPDITNAPPQQGHQMQPYGGGGPPQQPYGGGGPPQQQYGGGGPPGHPPQPQYK